MQLGREAYKKKIAIYSTISWTDKQLGPMSNILCITSIHNHRSRTRTYSIISIANPGVSVEIVNTKYRVKRNWKVLLLFVNLNFHCSAAPTNPTVIEIYNKHSIAELNCEQWFPTEKLAKFGWPRIHEV